MSAAAHGLLQDSAKENMAPGVNPWFIAMAVILPAFMEMIDTSIASVCIPYIVGSLSASNDEATYVLLSTFFRTPLRCQPVPGFRCALAGNAS